MEYRMISPAPWTYDAKWRTVGSGRGDDFMILEPYGTPAARDEFDRNVQLIVAAPALLEALHEAVSDFLESHTNPKTGKLDPGFHLPSWLVPAADAIKKATGIDPLERPVAETLEWEGLTWTKTDANLPISFKCDGCSLLRHDGTYWVASDGQSARWCLDCTAIAKGHSR